MTRPQRPPGPVLYARTGPHGPRWPEGRYGQRGVQRRPNLVLLVVVTLLVAFVVAALVVRAADQIGVRVDSYEVLSKGTVHVEATITRDPARGSECLVRARGVNGNEVGREIVPVPTGGPRDARLRVDLVTTERAVTGEVAGCRYVKAAR